MEGKHTFISYEDVLKMDLEDEIMESTEKEEEGDETPDTEETTEASQSFTREEKDYLDALVIQLIEAKRKNTFDAIQAEKRELVRRTSTNNFIIGMAAGALALGAGLIAYDYISNRNSNIVIE